MTLQGLNQCLTLLESHCHSSGLGFLGSDGQSWAIEVDHSPGTKVTYGLEAHTKELFLRQLQTQCNPVAAIFWRSFTAEIDPLSQLPIKELRGYVLKRQGDQLEEEKLSPEKMLACQNTDAQTGEPLALEQSVRYC